MLLTVVARKAREELFIVEEPTFLFASGSCKQCPKSHVGASPTVQTQVSSHRMLGREPKPPVWTGAHRRWRQED